MPKTLLFFFALLYLSMSIMAQGLFFGNLNNNLAHSQTHVQTYSGVIKVMTRVGVGTEFVIQVPNVSETKI
jgi:hypothetical protein